MNPPAENAQRIARLAPVAEILRQVEALAQPVRARETSLAEALGAVLAADVAAPARVPARAIAIADGWAVRADQLLDAGPYSPMPLLGASPWVEVGDPLPAEADAVLPPDAVIVNDDLYEAVAAVAPGTGVLAAGAYAELGAVLKRAGERLRATDLAVLAALGIGRVQVRRPNIRIAVTDPKLGHDTVAALLARAVEAQGGIATMEDAAPLERALLGDGADAVFVVGGTGQGRRDASVTALSRVGSVAIHGYGIAPGETGAIGAAGARPVLLFPGRLDAALAVWLLVGAPLVARLSGANEPADGTEVRLTRKVASQVGLAEVVPLRRVENGVEPLGSAPLSLAALAQADGWMLVPPESEGFPVGARVNMRALP